MKTRKEFLEACIEYFGDPGSTVINLIADDIKYIKPTEYSKIFKQLITTHPASWKIDFKSYTEAVRKCNIVFLDSEYKEKKCPVCNTLRYTTGGCPKCKYDNKTDGNPDEYRKFWESWESGEIEHIDVQKIISDLAQAKRPKESI